MNIKCLLWCSVAAYLISFSSFATSNKESEELKIIVVELKYLQKQVEDIKKMQRIDDTEKLDYSALLHDLKLISEGIERHVNGPSRQPRSIEIIEGEY